MTVKAHFPPFDTVDKPRKEEQCYNGCRTRKVDTYEDQVWCEEGWYSETMLKAKLAKLYNYIQQDTQWVDEGN